MKKKTFICFRYVELLVYFNFIAVLILKAWLTIYPYNFINSNQELIFKIMFFLIFTFLGFEIFVSFYFYGTFCPRDFVQEMNSLHEYKLDENSVRRSSYIMHVTGYAGLLAEIGSRVFTIYKNRKKMNKRKMVRNETKSVRPQLPLDANPGKTQQFLSPKMTIQIQFRYIYKCLLSPHTLTTQNHFICQ